MPDVVPTPMPRLAPTGDAAQKSGTITTTKGQITWTLAPDGTAHAESGGQELDSTGTGASDGSATQNTEYSLTGKPPYLTIDYTLDKANRQAQVTLKSDASQLSLAITNINATVTSGTATVSGSLRGSAVNWQATVDLTSNPLLPGAIPGWPKGAFAGELQNASLFAPAANVVAPPSTTPGAGGAADPKHAFGVVGVLENAGAWCLGGAIAGSSAAPETLGTSVVAGCVGGTVASLLSDWVSWANQPDVPAEPPPPIDLPATEEVTGPVVTFSHDDPPPPPPPQGGDGNGDDDGGDDGSQGGDGGDGGDGGLGEGIDDQPGHQAN